MEISVPLHQENNPPHSLKASIVEMIAVVGDYVSITRRNDGTYHPNLRDVRIDQGFDVDDYADNVAREIRNALKGLVEEG